MDQTKNKKSTRPLILAMVVLVLIGIATAWVYYSRLNRAVDPRILPARMAYQSYNFKAQEGDFPGVLAALDSIAHYYQQVPHYQNSFELGVVNVNRAATYITVGLHIDSLRITNQLASMQDLTKKGLFDLAEVELNIGIQFYQDWSKKYKDLSEEQLETLLRKDFFKGFTEEQIKDQDLYFESRFKELQTAQWEIDRRLSVALTNLGMVFFHRDELEKAAELFKEALGLWEDNLNAENNINKMLGRPLKKRNFIQKMFPQSRKVEKSKGLKV